MPQQTIIIADDDLQLVNALTVRLETEGFNVIASQDAYHALAEARKHRPDLMLLDVNMPAGNGFSVQERITEIPELRNTPVVYITGESKHRVDQMAKQLGAFAVIHKPFETEELMDTVRAALGYWVYDQTPEYQR
jgi:DNA-binding response OmpR family regulator